MQHNKLPCRCSPQRGQWQPGWPCKKEIHHNQALSLCGVELSTLVVEWRHSWSIINMTNKNTIWHNSNQLNYDSWQSDYQHGANIMVYKAFWTYIKPQIHQSKWQLTHLECYFKLPSLSLESTFSLHISICIVTSVTCSYIWFLFGINPIFNGRELSQIKNESKHYMCYTFKKCTFSVNIYPLNWLWPFKVFQWYRLSVL